MAADKIILAVGQHARLDAFCELEPQRNTIKNTKLSDPGDPKSFAAGDIVEGDKTVVYAPKLSRRGDSSLFRRELAHYNVADLFDYFLRREASLPCSFSSPVGKLL